MVSEGKERGSGEVGVAVRSLARCLINVVDGDTQLCNSCESSGGNPRE